MGKRKYISEFALNALITRYALAQQKDLERDDLSTYFDKDHPCHIYIIARRPRITLEPSSFQITPDAIRFNFKIQRQNDFHTVPCKATNNFGRSDLTLNCPYPHVEFAFVAPDGTTLLNGKVAHLMTQFGLTFSDYLNLEVLYIGQSYGVDGARTAPQRLKSHSTLQSIYAEAISRSPDQDVWLMLCHVEFLLMIGMDPTQPTQTTLDEDTAHIHNVVHKPVSEQQQINFAEAALIRYFQPEYNVMFKNVFPNPAHKTYSECYDVDLNSVMIEVQTEEGRFRLWSFSVSHEWVHMATFELHNREQRLSMFKMFDSDVFDGKPS